MRWWLKLKGWWLKMLETIRRWFYRETVLPFRKQVAFLLGFIAAILPLATGVWQEGTGSWIFIVAFLLILFVLLVVRPDRFRQLSFDHRWGRFSIFVLAYGLGALIYDYRAALAWLWSEFRLIDAPHEWLLVSLFFLGVILGFFIVRNWSKEQKDFITSLTAVFGSAFLATFLGDIGSNSGNPAWKLDPLTTFAYYALGFTLSGAINLISFAFLTAHYSSTQSITSRAIIDFLYGSDKAKTIDGYFLKNFQEDTDYAKSGLVNTLAAYIEVIKSEYARKLDHKKRTERNGDLPMTSPPKSPPPILMSSPPAAGSPMIYCELVSIESEQSKLSSEGLLSPPAPRDDDTFTVKYRRLSDNDDKKGKIEAKMFRVAVSMRWNDTLEYIVAPGEYKKAFPYFGSIAGLALTVRQTIVMDRDRFKKFRTQDYVDGKSPSEVDQPRGLQKIDYLSYIAIPLIRNYGKKGEFPLGVLHVDTKLFALPQNSANLLGEDLNNIEPGIHELKCTRKDLDEFVKHASNLYDLQDENIRYLEKMGAVILPLIELYEKCRTGAT